MPRIFCYGARAVLRFTGPLLVRLAHGGVRDSGAYAVLLVVSSASTTGTPIPHAVHAETPLRYSFAAHKSRCFQKVTSILFTHAVVWHIFQGVRLRTRWPLVRHPCWFHHPHQSRGLVAVFPTSRAILSRGTLSAQVGYPCFLPSDIRLGSLLDDSEESVFSVPGYFPPGEVMHPLLHLYFSVEHPAPC